MKSKVIKSLFVMCLAAPAALSATSSAYAALASEGHAAGAQCSSSDVNDTGVVVGNCAPANSVGPNQPWVATTAGVETLLPLLATGQGCTASGIDNIGVIIGECLDANNKSLGVRWLPPYTAPTVLSPLSGVGGLGADVASMTTGFNEAGVEIGESISANGVEDETAVVWLAGSTTPLPVSAANDNCAAVDVSDSTVSAGPIIALDCPNSADTVTAKVGSRTGLLGSYALSNLPVPAGYSYCTVVAVNINQQFLGTCHTVAPDAPKAAFWSSSTATPALTTGTTRNAGAYLNDSGHAVINYQLANGKYSSAFWIPATGALTLIGFIPSGTYIVASGIGNNDKVPLIGDDSAEHTEAAIWTPTAGTVAQGFEGGGLNSALSSISKSGNESVGVAENSAHGADAVHIP